jgi:hypothetical protein
MLGLLEKSIKKYDTHVPVIFSVHVKRAFEIAAASGDRSSRSPHHMVSEAALIGRERIFLNIKD